MRFLHTFTAGFFLLLGVFTNRPPGTVMAKPAPKTVEKAIKENSKYSKKAGVLASGKKQSTQNSSAAKPKAPSVSTVDYDKIIAKQLSEFFERDLAKNIAALPLQPIVTITVSNLPNGLKKAFLLGDKIYPGFSTLAQLFISGSIGGTDCPGVDPNAPCYILLFPHKESIVAPLICFKATPESLVVKNLRSEANQSGSWQLIPSSPITEKTYNVWMAGPKGFFSDFKDFSIVTTLFDPKANPFRHTFSVEIDIESLSAFMPLRVLKLAYDTYTKKDFEKIVFGLDIDEKELKIFSRYQAKPKTPWSVFCKAINERKKTFRSLDFPSEAEMQTILCWDASGSKILLKALSTYAKEAEWERDPIACQVYRWGQLLYPLLESYLDFEGTASNGNGQFYNLKSGRYDGFWIEEVKPAMTDRRLVDFLKSFVEKCTQQFSTAIKERLWDSDRIDGFCFKEKVSTYRGCDIHKCIMKVRACGSNTSEKLTECALFAGLYKGYLLYASSVENMKRVLEQMQAMQTFHYRSHSDIVALTQSTFPKNTCHGSIEFSRSTEVAPETFVTTVSFPVSFIEALNSLFFEGTAPEQPKNKSDGEKEPEKTNKSNVTNDLPKVSEPTRASEGDQNPSGSAIAAQSTAVR